LAHHGRSSPQFGAAALPRIPKRTGCFPVIQEMVVVDLYDGDANQEHKQTNHMRAVGKRIALQLPAKEEVVTSAGPPLEAAAPPQHT